MRIFQFFSKQMCNRYRNRRIANPHFSDKFPWSPSILYWFRRAQSILDRALYFVHFNFTSSCGYKTERKQISIFQEIHPSYIVRKRNWPIPVNDLWYSSLKFPIVFFIEIMWNWLLKNKNNVLFFALFWFRKETEMSPRSNDERLRVAEIFHLTE